MNASVNSTNKNAVVNPNNFIVPSFIDANFIAGRLSVGIYHMADRTTTNSFFFKNAANALNYAFLLKKRHGITIARRAFDLIMWEVKRTGAISSRAQRKVEAVNTEAKLSTQGEAEAAQDVNIAELPEQTTSPEKPKRQRAEKRTDSTILKQFAEMKKKHRDAILLFRCGDFYECFADDAVKASEILGITLTSRANGKADSIKLAGFPYHALDTYLPKLVRAGQRVAICEQLENPNEVKEAEIA